MKRPFTNSEIGAYLTAIGTVMHEHDLCAGAAADGNSEKRILDSLYEQEIEEEVAWELIKLSPEDAVNYMAPLPERK